MGLSKEITLHRAYHFVAPGMMLVRCVLELLLQITSFFPERRFLSCIFTVKR